MKRKCRYYTLRALPASYICIEKGEVIAPLFHVGQVIQSPLDEHRDVFLAMRINI